ncbi:ketopantoate reductase family protein [Enterococcus thailandicus]|uniref:ketopantoate reductase family protein n=1 Tax=Enterococcus thailandicus TaxID=417368 RepID=UPI0022DFBC1C|nr:2-dehydropantoate 2-reductase N-terminal domain-containing protein [Enterococcus thailandicus]
MKLLIYGAGIQGSYLAHIIAKNKENEVTILARGKTKEHLETNGLELKHVIQKKRTVDIIKIISKLEPTDKYDLIFVTMKYNDFDSVIEPIARNHSQRVIFVGNQMNPELLKEKIIQKNPAKQVFFGFQNTGGTREGNLITILRFNGGKMKIYLDSNEFEMTQLLNQVFARTNYQWQSDPTLPDWLKSHAALIMVLNSLDLIYRKKMKNKQELTRLFSITASAFKEAFTVLEENGYPIVPKIQKNLLQNEFLTKIGLRLMYATPLMASAQGSYTEIELIICSFERLKKETGTKTPNLDQLIKITAQVNERKSVIKKF